MPFEIPRHFNAETRSMVETALEEAWQELSKGTRVEATPTKRRLMRTMVALAAVGETDLKKLKSFAIQAWRGSLQVEQAMTGISRTLYAPANCPSGRLNILPERRSA